MHNVVTTAAEPTSLVVESNPISVGSTSNTTATTLPSTESNPSTITTSSTTTATTTNTANVPTPTPLPLDNAPLFWQPCSGGFYSIRAGRNTPERLNAYRNVGRILAVCLLQNELCPIMLSRHVIKYILSRPVKWHDLAFYDPQMYESFRKMICDAERILVDTIKTNESLNVAVTRADDEIFKPLDLTFNIDLSKEESSSSATLNTDIKENGSQVKVTAANMYEFVKLYAEFRMIKNIKLSLDQLKAGVYDVLPSSSLDGLHAEDFRLLLNGVADISIHTLASYTTISDESKETSRRPQFEKWFWTTLDRMSQQEKQELLFFWTGSSHLPASEEGFQPLPTITLRPPSDQHLPTANTCINRLYIPVYSSKSILKAKLLQAIKTKTFGFV